MELYCIYFPKRDKYQAAMTRTREPVPGLLVFRTFQAVNACIEALEKPGAVPKKMLTSELKAMCAERGICGSLMIMDDPEAPEVIYC